MHPTLDPSAPCFPTAQQRSQARADLSRMADPERRISFALGYLQSALADAIRHTHQATAASDALGRCMAILLELDHMQHEQSRYSYDREQVEDPSWVDPPGIEGYGPTGRGA